MVSNKYFAPVQAIKPRYNISNIPTTGNKGGIEQGYIFVPYIMVQSTPIIVMSAQMRRELLREERREKIKKLKW